MQGCSSNVTVCNKFGKELHLLCPFGLVFDGTIEECKDRKLVAECAKEPQKKKSSSRSLDGELRFPVFGVKLLGGGGGELCGFKNL